MSLAFTPGLLEAVGTPPANAPAAPLWVLAVGMILMGLRHASDPDHLVAVTELVADDEHGPARAARLGAAWGTGHALSLLILGAPMIWARWEMPPAILVWCERSVAGVILALAVRLLLRWVRGEFREPRALPRAPQAGLVRSGLVGVLHGCAGSAAVVLLITAIAATPLQAGLFLLLFAPMTAVSMVICSAIGGALIGGSELAQRLRHRTIPVLAAFSAAFGVWWLSVQA